MKRYVLITLTAVVLAASLAAPVAAQDSVSNLASDLQLFFDKLGGEIGPNLQTASVLNHGLGSAELGDFPRMYFSLSMGATVAPGILTFTADEDDQAQFENWALFESLLTTAGANDRAVRDITDNYAPYPSLRAGFGVGLARGWEVDVQAGVIPSAVTSLAPVDGLTASITTIGTRVRKVVVRQATGVPAISVGAGYVYSGINFGYDLSTLDPIDSGGQTLTLAGDAAFNVNSHSVGLDVRASTRFLRVSYPFIGVSGYFQNTTYEAGIDSFTIAVNNGTPTTPSIEPLSNQTFNDFNVVINAGSDIKLAIFNLFIHANYALSTRAPGVIMGLRVQI